MKIKKGLEISTFTDVWYDLTDGGHLKPEEICENQEDAEKVKQAIEIVKEFIASCEDEIEGFIQ